MITQRFVHIVMLLGLLTWPATRAAADPILRFDFSGTEKLVEGDSFQSMDGGATTVKAFGFLANGSPDALAWRTPFGLGVQNPNAPPVVAGDPNDKGPALPTPGNILQPIRTFHVDGRNGGEFLRLEFSSPVKLIAGNFDLISSFDRFGVAVAGNAPTFFAFPDTTGVVLFPTSLPFATAFDFYAPAWNGTKSEWNLQRVTVLVPEPSTAVLWSVMGVSLLGWRRWRTRAGRRNALASPEATPTR